MHWTERLTHEHDRSLSGHDASRWLWPLAGRGRVQVGRSHRRRRRGRTRPQRKAPLPRHPGTAVTVACMTPPAGVRQPYRSRKYIVWCVRPWPAGQHGQSDHCSHHDRRSLLYVRTYCRERRVASRVRWTDSIGSDGWAAYGRHCAASVNATT